MRTFFYATIAAVLPLAAAGCSWFSPTTAQPASRPAPPPVMPPTSEWFPSLVPPSTLTDPDRAALLRACGEPAASVVWTQYVDLDADRCTDALVTLALPPVTAEDGTSTWTTVTYVFSGRAEGAFTQPFAAGDRAFAVVTERATAAAGGAQRVTRRQFTVRRTPAGFFLTLNDTTYASAPAEAGPTVMAFVGSTTATVRVEDLPKDRPLPLPLERDGGE